MTDHPHRAHPHRALLPAGLSDALPPDAAHESALVEQLLASFGRAGYERVKPPLIEFEDNLLGGPGAGLAKQTFRLMDPVSQRMMAVRADQTPQIARIATTRLARAPRPLRLSYAGEVLRVKGTELRPERQFRQVGVELIGALEPAADAEVALLAAESLAEVGVRGLSLDLNVPTLVPAVCRAWGVEGDDRDALLRALDRRDATEVARVGGKAAGLASELLAATGRADRALDALARITLPAEAEPDRRRLVEAVALITAAAPGLTLTIDPVERRGFEYQSGLSFTVFARDVRGELGRGGRYRADDGTRDGEPAVGFTLFMDSLLRALPEPERPARLFVPFGTPAAEVKALRASGRIAVAGLAPVADPVAEARRLGCAAVWLDGAERPAD